MSKIKERSKQLASREKELKKKLVGGSSTKSKTSKIAKTALAGGAVALVLYIVYRSFFQEDKKPKKNKRSKSASGAITEKLIAFILPYLGELISGFLNRSNKSSNDQEVLDESNESSEED